MAGETGTLIRVTCLTGIHYDLLVTAPFAVFVSVVRGDGGLLLSDPRRIIPYHAIADFQELTPDQGTPGLATWQSQGGMN